MSNSYQDPFEDYKKRLQKKLARKAEAEKNGMPVDEKKKDDVNWFGVKVGAEVSMQTQGGGGVGKYLNLKRPLETTKSALVADDSKKKRRLGFGDFDAW